MDASTKTINYAVQYEQWPSFRIAQSVASSVDDRNVSEWIIGQKQSSQLANEKFPENNSSFSQADGGWDRAKGHPHCAQWIENDYVRLTLHFAFKKKWPNVPHLGDIYWNSHFKNSRTNVYESAFDIENNTAVIVVIVFNVISMWIKSLENRMNSQTMTFPIYQSHRFRQRQNLQPCTDRRTSIFSAGKNSRKMKYLHTTFWLIFLK